MYSTTEALRYHSRRGCTRRLSLLLPFLQDLVFSVTPPPPQKSICPLRRNLGEALACPRELAWWALSSLLQLWVTLLCSAMNGTAYPCAWFGEQLPLAKHSRLPRRNLRVPSETTLLAHCCCTLIWEAPMTAKLARSVSKPFKCAGLSGWAFWHNYALL